MPAPMQIGLLAFPNMTQLDLAGPLQVLSSVPDVDIHLIWKDLEPVPTDTVMVVTPTMTLSDCPQLDVVCVPGGHGTDELVNDSQVLDFLRDQAERARYITSVCTGSLVLGAAGLLQGYNAATHWTAMEFLAPFGAVATFKRVVVDRDRITGGGVTAGIDFALTLIAEIFDRETAEDVQLRLEYNPAPPFDAGSPTTAPADVVSRCRDRSVPTQLRREQAVARAAARLRVETPLRT